MNKLAIFALFAIVCVVASSTTARPSPKEVFSPQALSKMGGLLCDICKDLVRDAEDAGTDYSDHWLDDHISSMCSRLGFFSSVCTDLLEKLVGDLDDMIKQRLSPDVCCNKVDCC